MKIRFHLFRKTTPLQFSKLEKIHDGYYEISLGRFWVSVELNEK